MRYSPVGADDIHDFAVMIYQACGLDKKRSICRQTNAPFCLLVDQRGVEPLSENLFTGPSPWAVYDLEFPAGGDHRQPPSLGSPFMLDRCKSELSVQVHHYVTLQPEPWYSPGERAA